MHLLSSCSGEKVTRAVWVPDAMSKDCMVCGQRFTAFVRKHHCRQCGQVVCSSCSPYRIDMRPADGSREPKAERTCKKCFQQHKAVLPTRGMQPHSIQPDILTLLTLPLYSSHLTTPNLTTPHLTIPHLTTPYLSDTNVLSIVDYAKLECAKLVYGSLVPRL